MKFAFLLFFSFTLYVTAVFSQDTSCYTSIKYGDNSKAGNFANVNGIKMYYEIYGNPDKQPLLLIHGNGGSIYSMRCQIDHFKKQYYIIAADSRFHGKSGNGAETLTYDLMAEDYNALLDFLQIDSAYIIGQSDGGIIGLLLAMNYSKKVKKLITVSPNIQPDGIEDWLLGRIKNQRKEIQNKISEEGKSEDLRRQWELQNLMTEYPDISDKELSKINAPVLVMASDVDAIKLDHILEIYKNIPKAQLFIMPGATHIMLRQEPTLFNQIVERFLNITFKRPTTKEALFGESN